MQTCLRVLGVVAGLLAGPAMLSNALAAQIAVDPADTGTLSLKGEIAPGDAGRLLDAVKAAKQVGTSIDTLRVNSVGGEVEAGVQLAKTVRALKLDTVVGNGDQCASMCVLVYAAGIRRTFDPGGLLAVHSVSTYRDNDPQHGYEDDSAKATTLDLARLYMQFGTPDRIVGRMITATGGQLAYLSRADIEDSGFASAIEPVQAIQAVQNWSMTCSLDGVASGVIWHPDQTLQVGTQRYKIAESHKAKTGAWVAQADSPDGLLQAVFGGPEPRLIHGTERADCEVAMDAGLPTPAEPQKSAVSPLISQSP